MADQKTVKGDKPRPVHPEVANVPALCVDAIDLGECVKQYKGEPPYIAEEYAFIFYTGAMNPDTGRPFEVKVQCTVSMGKKANLRKLLENWRGKPYTPEQLEKGVDLHRLVGHWGLITIANEVSDAGNRYAKVMSVTPMHPDIRKPDLPAYTRDKFWDKVKEENKLAVAKFRADNGVGNESFNEMPTALEADDDDLPF